MKVRQSLSAVKTLRRLICVIDMDDEFEMRLVDALNGLHEVIDKLPYAMKVTALDYTDGFEAGFAFTQDDIDIIEGMVNKGMDNG